jgi:hypothetical protein
MPAFTATRKTKVEQREHWGWKCWRTGTVPGLDQRTSEREAATGMAKFFARVLDGAGGAATRPSMLVARGSRTVRRRWMERVAGAGRCGRYVPTCEPLEMRWSCGLLPGYYFDFGQGGYSTCPV